MHVVNNLKFGGFSLSSTVELVLKSLTLLPENKVEHDQTVKLWPLLTADDPEKTASSSLGAARFACVAAFFCGQTDEGMHVEYL